MKSNIPHLKRNDEVQHKYPQFGEKEVIQHKVPLLKVHTGIRIGECWWDYNCQKYWC